MKPLKHYYCFFTYQYQLYIVRLSAKNKQQMEQNLRNAGVRVTLVLSEKVYDEYCELDHRVFMKTYGHKFTEYRYEQVMKKMFGKVIENESKVYQEITR